MSKLKRLTKKDILEMLKDLPDDGGVDIFILPDDEGLRFETDEHDIKVDSLHVIYTGGVEDGGAIPPYIEVGVVVGEKTRFKECTKTD
jgi:hypothetical protein